MTTLTFTIPGEPVSKARARFTGYGSKTRTYTPKKTMDAEAAVARAFRGAGGAFEPDPEVTFSVSVTFHNGTRQRRDVDNMLKLILDGLNGVAWVDDTQVMEVSGRKCFTSRTEARTEVKLEPIGRMDRLVVACQECGVEFITYKSWGTRRHCSDACALKKRRLARLRICESCGVEFDPGKPSQRRFCSRPCQTASGWTEIPCDRCGATFPRRKCHIKAVNYCTSTCRDATFAERRQGRAKGKCADCAGPTSDKRRVRCQVCQWAYRRANSKGVTKQ